VSLYRHLKASQTSPLSPSSSGDKWDTSTEETAKPSQTSLARATERSVVPFSSYKEDIRDGHTLENNKDISTHAQVTFGTVPESEREKSIPGWINANPPELPEHQNSCAACGVYIPVYDTGWVILGDGALIHYGDKHGTDCWERWRQKRRDEALS
jgi:hypothetical protein